MGKTGYTAKLLTLSFLTSCVLLLSNCKKEDLPVPAPEIVKPEATVVITPPQPIPQPQPIPVTVVTSPKVDSVQKNTVLTDGIISTSYYIINCLPSGYVKDGSRDYTNYIQTAINSNSNLVFPAFPILINEKGLSISSNKTISFLPGSEIRLKPTSSSNYDILSMRSASNVTLYNPVIIGDSQNHLGSGGEWGMGIGIYSAENITIYNPTITYCWGDGIYVGRQNSVISRNISISKAYVKYNRRNGISVTAVDGLKLESPYAGFSTGILPMTGITFEPNNGSDELKNILVTNAVTEGNAAYGIMVSLAKMFGGGNKTIEINIINPTDIKSNKGFKASLFTQNRVGSETIKGTILLENPYMKQNPASPIFTALFGKDDLFLKITNPRERDLSGKELSNSEVLAKWTSKSNINKDAWYTLTF